MMPPPNSAGMPIAVRRKEGMAAAMKVETAQEALAKRAAGGKKPAHYIPTEPLKPEAITSEDVASFDPYNDT